MEPPAATARIKDGRCEVWACAQSPQAVRNDVAKRLGLRPGERDRQRHAARRRLRPQVQGRLRDRGGAARAGNRRASRSRSSGRATTTCTIRSIHTVSVEHLEAGLDKAGKPIAWLHRSVGADVDGAVLPDPKTESPIETRHGADQRAVRGAQHAHREPRSGRAHAHRLVSRGLQHPARVRHPVVRGRDGARGGTRPEGLPARAARAGAPDRPARRSTTPGTTARTRRCTRSTSAGCAA